MGCDIFRDPYNIFCLPLYDCLSDPYECYLPVYTVPPLYTLGVSVSRTPPVGLLE